MASARKSSGFESAGAAAPSTEKFRKNTEPGRSQCPSAAYACKHAHEEEESVCKPGPSNSLVWHLVEAQTYRRSALNLDRSQQTQPTWSAS